MHPAFSVIAFTTLCGFGYGLMSLLGVFAPLGLLPDEPVFGLAALALAVALVTFGLLSSTMHLGRPERAWRAFSQWQSSWLSREGVASVITYVPAVLFGFGWFFRGLHDPWTLAAGGGLAVCALTTVATTGMIYASLKPIPQWNTGYTTPGYLLFALMSGATLLSAVCLLFGTLNAAATAVAAIATATGWLWKALTWQANDALRLPATLNTATGLAGGSVRSIEWPHTEENYLLKEMGYRVARKHAAKLRRFVHCFAFAVPLIASMFALILPYGPAVVMAILAVVAQAMGLLVERWLFFAEAKHIVTLYYGR
jgi:DMSO reductase anchor subunit